MYAFSTGVFVLFSIIESLAVHYVMFTMYGVWRKTKKEYETARTFQNSYSYRARESITTRLLTVNYGHCVPDTITYIYIQCSVAIPFSFFVKTTFKNNSFWPEYETFSTFPSVTYTYYAWLNATRYSYALGCTTLSVLLFEFILLNLCTKPTRQKKK